MNKSIVITLCLLATGCTSVVDLGKGRVAVPRYAEVRSPFGTNAGFIRVDECYSVVKKEEGLQPLFPTVEYVDCVQATNWEPVSSQGQGGQIVQGALIGGGIAGGAALLRPSTVTGNATANSASNATSNSVSSAPTSITNNVTTSVQNGAIHSH